MVTTGPNTSFWTISCVLGDVRDDRRLDEEAAVAERLATGDDGRLRVDGPLEEAEHALLLLCRDDRAHPISSSVAGSPTVSASTALTASREHVVVDPLADEDPRRGGAVLTGVEVAADLDRLGDGRRVGVVEHDHRRLAAELEVDALDGVAPRSAAMSFPVAVSPVSETRRMSGCWTSASPTGTPSPVTTWRTPGGRTSCASSTKRSSVSGVCSAGLMIWTLPAASAGPIFQTAMNSG